MSNVNLSWATSRIIGLANVCTVLHKALSDAWQKSGLVQRADDGDISAEEAVKLAFGPGHCAEVLTAIWQEIGALKLRERQVAELATALATDIAGILRHHFAVKGCKEQEVWAGVWADRIAPLVVAFWAEVDQLYIGVLTDRWEKFRQIHEDFSQNWPERLNKAAHELTAGRISREAVEQLVAESDRHRGTYAAWQARREQLRSAGALKKGGTGESQAARHGKAFHTAYR